MVARLREVSIAALSILVSTAAIAQAQTASERLKAAQQRLDLIKKEAISKLPPQLQKALSGARLNELQAAEGLERFAEGLSKAGNEEEALANIKAALESRRASPTKSVASLGGPVLVNNPSTDLLFSLLEGMTQSETSTAWCGSGVVVGFNDSGSYLESLLFGPGGISFSGAGASTDYGNSFTDVGYINPGSNPNNFLAGDPVVNCTTASTFYYSQIGDSSEFINGVLTPTSTVMISKSTNGGFTWDNPVPAVSKNAIYEATDKDWSTIDPNNPKDIYVSYTDFDLRGFYFPDQPCPNLERIAIEIVHSTDGGFTWSAPTTVAQVCDTTGNFVQGSQIVVDSRHNVYVEWEEFPNGFGTPRIFRIRKSTDHAVSFGPASTIDIGFGDGDGFYLQGVFRSWLTGNLAVDRSGTATDGYLYLVWEDGRFAERIDLESPTGVYRFANVVISRSTNGGKSWSSPVRVNDDPLYSDEGVGIDHFQPGVAVNGKGELAACWYDRRDDPFNFRIGRFCGTSTNYGKSWSNAKVDPRTWPPIHDMDALINTVYLGDYDTVTTDKLKTSWGFQGAYGPVNDAFGQDVFLVHIH